MPLKIRCTGKCHLTMKVKVWDITEGLPKGQSCVLKVKSDIVKENRWRKEMSAFVGTSLSNVDFGGHLHAATEALLIYSKPRILLLWILRFFFSPFWKNERRDLCSLRVLSQHLIPAPVIVFICGCASLSVQEFILSSIIDSSACNDYKPHVCTLGCHAQVWIMIIAEHCTPAMLWQWQ